MPATTKPAPIDLRPRLLPTITAAGFEWVIPPGADAAEARRLIESAEVVDGLWCDAYAAATYTAYGEDEPGNYCRETKLAVTMERAWADRGERILAGDVTAEPFARHVKSAAEKGRDPVQVWAALLQHDGRATSDGRYVSIGVPLPDGVVALGKDQLAARRKIEAGPVVDRHYLAETPRSEYPYHASYADHLVLLANGRPGHTPAGPGPTEVEIGEFEPHDW